MLGTGPLNSKVAAAVRLPLLRQTLRPLGGPGARSTRGCPSLAPGITPGQEFHAPTSHSPVLVTGTPRSPSQGNTLSPTTCGKGLKNIALSPESRAQLGTGTTWHRRFSRPLGNGQANHLRKMLLGWRPLHPQLCRDPQNPPTRPCPLLGEVPAGLPTSSLVSYPLVGRGDRCSEGRSRQGLQLSAQL